MLSFIVAIFTLNKIYCPFAIRNKLKFCEFFPKKLELKHVAFFLHYENKLRENRSLSFQ